jgi:hypothetical protein
MTTTCGWCVLALAVALAGCASSLAASSSLSAQDECRHHGGIWKPAAVTCEYEAGGGGSGSM